MYSLTEIAERKLFPWVRNERSVRKHLEADLAGPNLLKAQITGADSQKRYLVSGKNIIKYLQIHGLALMATARKPKQKDVKKTSGENRNKRRAKKAR